MNTSVCSEGFSSRSGFFCFFSSSSFFFFWGGGGGGGLQWDICSLVELPVLFCHLSVFLC